MRRSVIEGEILHFVQDDNYGVVSPSFCQRITEHLQMTFTEAYLAEVTMDDFRKNPRGELGTRTATLHKEGIRKLRDSWIYRL